MPKFTYRAKKGPREIIEDTIEAASKDEAIEKISLLGFLPVYLEEASVQGVSQAPARSEILRGSVHPKEITIFSRQLASLLKSGVPILRSLYIIAQQSESPALRVMLEKIASDVKEGKSFSSALESAPRTFSNFYIALVRSGEDSGTLKDALLRIADYRQKQEAIASKVRAAMAYPILMLLVGLGTIIFMLVFVMPKLSAIFVNMAQDLPLPTRIVIRLSSFMKERWPYLLGGHFILFFLIARTSTFRARKKVMSFIALRVPVLGVFLRKNDFSRFSRTLEILLKSGLPILRAIAIAIPVLDNEIIKSELARCAGELEQGSGFGLSLKKSKLFPPFLVSLITVGEESGKLDEALAEIADAYERDCDEAIGVITSLLEPLMILVMGLIVGFLVMAMLLPIFQMNVMAR